MGRDEKLISTMLLLKLIYKGIFKREKILRGVIST